jgi:rhodanese-related sulfurtransferase
MTCHPILNFLQNLFFLMRDTIKISGQALCVIMVSTALAFAVNALRPLPLSLVMPFAPEYRCSTIPQSGLPVRVEPALTMFGRGDVLFVDARPSQTFEKGHIEKARNIPYSFLDPVGEETVRELKRYKSVIVYCNRKDAQVSMTMAGELSQEGVTGATYLEGGFLEWVKAGGKYTGQKPNQYD